MLDAPQDIGTSSQWHTIGNRPAITLLSGALKQQRTAHAYLFTGPNRVGKRTLAVDFARALNCNAQDVITPGWDDLQPEPPCGQCSACDRIARSNFADVQIINAKTQSSKDPDPTAAQRRVMIGIDLIKDLQSDALLEPYEGRVKVFIIDEANRMSPDAANALLKTLEEPPSSVHIILTAPSAQSVPETIASRCHLVRLRSVPPETIAAALVDRHDIPHAEARSLAKMSMGAPGWAIAAINDPSLIDARKQSASRIIETTQADLPDRFDYAFQMNREFRRNRESAIEEIERWLEILRDIAMLQNDLNQHIIFDDRIDELTDLAKKLTTQDLAQATSAAQKTREALMSNAYPQLAFDAMMLQIPSTQ